MRAFRLAYDGTGYYGFQRQPDVPTVEDAVFDALAALGVYEPSAHRPTGYAAAGRTDAGVSATHQTIAVAAPDWLEPRAFNAELPADVRAWASADVPAAFHATRDATRRTYTYHLYAPADQVDDERAAAALEVLSGTHDLHNLTPDDERTERTLSLAAERDGDFLRLAVSAGGFSRQLVRRLVSLVDGVARHDLPFERIDRVLTADPLPGHLGIEPAPPEPLVLSAVTYPDVSFAIDAAAAAGARRLFDRRRIERTVGARVSRALRDGIGPGEPESRREDESR